jgi:hypothetical protein
MLVSVWFGRDITEKCRQVFPGGGGLNPSPTLGSPRVRSHSLLACLSVRVWVWRWFVPMKQHVVKIVL